MHKNRLQFCCEIKECNDVMMYLLIAKFAIITLQIIFLCAAVCAVCVSVSV